MKFYMVFETENGKYTHLRDVYLTIEDAQTNAKQIGKSQHWTEQGWVDNVYTYEITEIELENPTFDIYIDSVSRSGERISGLTYEKALKMYDRCAERGKWVILQLPLKQFDGLGVTKIKTNEDAEYWRQYNAYWEREEEEERENEYYSPSCPWGAPGMSISDFI